MGVYFIRYTKAPGNRTSHCEHIEADDLSAATSAAEERAGEGDVLEVAEAPGVEIGG
jgi:hypothetical protein